MLESYLDGKRTWLAKAVEEMRLLQARARELVDGSARWLGHWRDVHIKAGRAQMKDESDGFFVTVKDQDDLPKIAGFSTLGQGAG